MRRASLLFAFLLPALVAIVPSQAKEIKIGLITPLSGDVKTFGESVRNSFLIAVEEANARGGVGGAPRGSLYPKNRPGSTSPFT